jgi:NADPH:quinone reductase-like Zn-dependent oxidoreductase
LNPKGIYIAIGGPSGSTIGILVGWITALVWSWFVSQKFLTFIARSNKEDLTIIRELMATGKVTPVIDRHYKLSEVPEAIRYLEEGHARGKVVITSG